MTNSSLLSRLESSIVGKLAWLCFTSIGLLSWYYSTVHYIQTGSDFTQDYVAAWNFRQGGGIYGNDILLLARQLLGLEGILNFHPPFHTLIFVPLSYLSYYQAHLVFNFLSLLLYAGILMLIAKEYQWPRKRSFFLFPLLLFWHPFIECISLGQSSIIISFCIVLAWVCLRRGASAYAGIFVAVATLMKLYPGLLLILLLLRKDWRAVSSFALTFCYGMASAAALFGVDQVLLYSREISSQNIASWGMFVANISLYGFFLPLFKIGPWSVPLIDQPQVALMLYLLSVAALLLTIIYKGHQLLRTKADDKAFALFCIGLVLLSPISWTHILVLMLLVLAILNASPISKYQRKIVLVALILFSLPTYEVIRSLQSLAGQAQLPWYFMVMTKAGFYGLLLLLVIAVSSSNRSQIK